MSTTEPTTPNKYRPSERRYTDKQWLYKQYWANLESIAAVAAQTSVSTTTITRQLEAHGIPKRERHTPTSDHETVGSTLRNQYSARDGGQQQSAVCWQRD